MVRVCLFSLTALLSCNAMLGMHRATRVCRPITRKICYQRPLKMSSVKKLLESQTHADDHEEVRSQLHSLCNGFKNYLNAGSVEEFRENTPQRIQEEINESVIHAYYKTKAGGCLYTIASAATFSVGTALALKAGDISLMQEPFSNLICTLTSSCSLMHTAYYTALRAYEDLEQTPANIEINMIYNTALVKDHLKQQDDL